MILRSLPHNYAEQQTLSSLRLTEQSSGMHRKIICGQRLLLLVVDNNMEYSRLVCILENETKYSL